MKFWKKEKVKVYNISKVWDEKGQICWSMSYDDFNKMFAEHNGVVCIDGKVCATVEFAGQFVVVYREEKKGI